MFNHLPVWSLFWRKKAASYHFYEAIGNRCMYILNVLYKGYLTVNSNKQKLCHQKEETNQQPRDVFKFHAVACQIKPSLFFFHFIIVVVVCVCLVNIGHLNNIFPGKRPLPFDVQLSVNFEYHR